jgi:translation initiation factor 5B
LECIDILKQYKTPFIIALNKIDLLSGWRSTKEVLLKNIQGQAENIRTLIEKKLYEIVGKLAELDFEAERFDRVEDHTKQIAIVPTSAKTSEGVPELLMVLTGLAQKFLEKNLKMDVEGSAKGTVLEVKEEKGLGMTIDAIIYDGTLRVGDTIVIGTLTEPIVTKVKALFEPMPLKEMREKKMNFDPVKLVSAATGVKISAPDIEGVVSGMPLIASSDVESAKVEIKKEIEEVLVETDKEGIIIKADSLGSLEALTKLLKEKNIPIKKTSIGNISKKDIADGGANYEKNPLQAAILGFNVALMPGMEVSENVKVITNDVIYKLIEDFEKWQEFVKKEQEVKEMGVLVKPCKIKLLKGYVFRQNNPAVVGVEVLQGTLKVDTQLMKDEGDVLTQAKEIQLEKKSINEVEKGKQVAVSLPKVTVGRQINEEDILYSFIPEDDFRKLKEFKKLLNEEEKTLLKEIVAIMRKKNAMWGI